MMDYGNDAYLKGGLHSGQSLWSQQPRFALDSNAYSWHFAPGISIRYLSEVSSGAVQREATANSAVLRVVQVAQTLLAVKGHH